MLQNQSLQPHNTTYSVLQVGSPPPTLACPSCPRHFHSKGGRTKHIRAKHANGPNPHASNLTRPLALSPVPTSPNLSLHTVQFERPPSPIPSDSTASSPRPPSRGEVDLADNFADIGVEADYLQLDRDHRSPDLNVNDEMNEDLPPRDNPMERIPNPPHTSTYIYHPHLNGK
jgi:hypothetical protein